MPPANDDLPRQRAEGSVALQRRRNMADRREEAWRPPLLATQDGWASRLLAAVRRWLDLQAGSIWNDLAQILAQATGKVLDVGCGAQPYRCLLPREVDYLGIDVVGATADFGYQAAGTVYYSGRTWPVADGTVDLVLATETLEHVFEVPQFLGEAGRCLRPGGRLVATVPFAARWHFIPHDFWRFTPACLKRLLAEAGFEDIAVYARGNAVTVACYKVMALILPLLMPQTCGPWQRLGRRLLGLLTAPVFVLCATIGNVSLRGAGGDDCLGYTIVARRGSKISPMAPLAPQKS